MLLGVTTPVKFGVWIPASQLWLGEDIAYSAWDDVLGLPAVTTILPHQRPVEVCALVNAWVL